MIVAHSQYAIYMGETLFGVVVYTPDLIDHDDGWLVSDHIDWPEENKGAFLMIVPHYHDHCIHGKTQFGVVDMIQLAMTYGWLGGNNLGRPAKIQELKQPRNLSRVALGNQSRKILTGN